MLVNRILTLQPDEAIEADSDVVNPNSQPSMYPNRLKLGGYGPKRSRQPNAPKSSEPTVQGALILQSMLRLSDPHNTVVCEGLVSSLKCPTLKLDFGSYSLALIPCPRRHGFRYPEVQSLHESWMQ